MEKNYYREEQLREAALKYFNGDILATNIWINKYALKNKNENNYLELTPDDTLKRITKEIHRIEEKYPNPLSYEEIYKTIKNFKYFIFGGSILFGLGNSSHVSLGNCFFVDNNSDSYGGIFNIDESIAQLMKRRGGVGITLENLRPSTAKVNNSAQTSTGAVSFINRFSNTTREVAQDGRRGALMVSMSVNHPDISDFIKIKDDENKVTGANISVKITDEFMNAVKNNEDYILSWPTQKRSLEIKEKLPYNKIIKIDEKTYVKKVKAKDIWESIVNQAHKNAEPGVLFWDNIIKESPADCYSSEGFETKGTNPCIVGDTLIAVADGRNAVSIKQLVNEGKDVPVYCLDDKGKINIQIMRNPRITGYNQPIYEVKFDSGDSIKCTSNHKIRLKDGSYKEAKDLVYGDSVYVMERTQLAWDDICNSVNSQGVDYIWVRNGGQKTLKSEHKLIYEFNENMKIPADYVIHHKDFNSLNNSFDNLKIMERCEHTKFHSELIKGLKNPYHRMSNEWKKKFASNPGLQNHTAYQVSNEELIEKGLEFGKQLRRRFSKTEWIDFAEKNNLPKFIKPYRGFNGVYEFSLFIASELGFEYSDKDPRILKRYKEALQNGYNTKIIGNELFVEKICEECGEIFWTYYDRREYAICSKLCSNKYINRTTNINNKRTNTLSATYKQKGEEKTQAQLKIYSDLKFELGREPMLKEWSIKCKSNGVSDSLKTKYGLKSFNEVKEYAESYNHKVIGIQFCGYENVYNGTVDKWHNFCIGGFKSLNEVNKSKWLYINNLQCGEVPLSSWDSCRLGSINIFSFVKKPFTKKAKFDWAKLAKISRYTQRFMDNIVGLEEEKIIDIIKKIENDPEDPEIKKTELLVWNKILEILRKGRRTGIGILGLGDAIASLGLTYGSKNASKFAEEVQQYIAVNSYRESVKLAKERGCFPIWCANKEAGNPFIRRTISNNFNIKEYNDYLEYGRRNIATLSIAPTGSLSILSQTTSGIEPVFKIFFRRRRKINPHEEGVKISYTDALGDSWEEYNVIHYPFIQWYVDSSDKKITFEEAHKYLKEEKEEVLQELVNNSPWGGSESYDIDYIEKIKMQGAIQKWIDHSISVTHNLPENISQEKVNDIYFEGWNAGCKGLTIYREGSRSGVLLSNKKDVVKFEEHHAPKRPKELEADYFVSTAKGIKFAVIIGKLEEKPYEIFAFENPPLNKNTTGKIIKIRKGHYKFVNGDFEISDLQLAAERIEERTLTLTTSMLLRQGAPIKYVIRVIKKIDENITSFSSVVRRTLSRYIDEELSEENCPNCQDKLIMQDGCIQCINPNCGYSKCG